MKVSQTKQRFNHANNTLKQTGESDRHENAMYDFSNNLSPQTKSKFAKN